MFLYRNSFCNSESILSFDKINLSLRLETEPVTVGADATVYIWVLSTHILLINQTYTEHTVASTLFEQFWRILLYVTDDAFAKLYVT